MIVNAVISGTRKRIPSTHFRDEQDHQDLRGPWVTACADNRCPKLHLRSELREPRPCHGHLVARPLLTVRRRILTSLTPPCLPAARAVERRDCPGCVCGNWSPADASSKAGGARGIARRRTSSLLRRGTRMYVPVLTCWHHFADCEGDHPVQYEERLFHVVMHSMMSTCYTGSKASWRV
jgi:hypothetical protein